MSDVTKKDETGTVEVVVSGLRLDAVRISNLWKDRFEADALASTLSQLIREALPPKRAPEPREPHRDKHLPLSSVPAFIAELRAGRKATRRYLERLRAGEVRKRPETRIEDPEKRVDISLVGGRFNAVLLDPEWAGKTTIQDLCDKILAAFEDVVLLEEFQLDPDITEARGHYDAARACLTD